MYPRYELATKLAVLVLILIPIIGPIATAHAYKKQLPPETGQSIFYPTMVGIIISVGTIVLSTILILFGIIGI